MADDSVDELAARRRHREVLGAARAFGYCAPCTAIMERAALTAVPFVFTELCDRCRASIEAAIARQEPYRWTAPLRMLELDTSYRWRAVPDARLHPNCRCAVTPLDPPPRVSWWRRLITWFRLIPYRRAARKAFPRG